MAKIIQHNNIQQYLRSSNPDAYTKLQWTSLYSGYKVLVIDRTNKTINEIKDGEIWWTTHKTRIAGSYIFIQDGVLYEVAESTAGEVAEELLFQYTQQDVPVLEAFRLSML